MAKKKKPPLLLPPPLLLLLNPSSSQDATLAGRLTGAVDLTYPGAAIDRASGRLELTDFLAQKEGVSLKLAEPVSGRMVQGALTMPAPADSRSRAGW